MSAEVSGSLGVERNTATTALLVPISLSISLRNADTWSMTAVISGPLVTTSAGVEMPSPVSTGRTSALPALSSPMSTIPKPGSPQHWQSLTLEFPLDGSGEGSR